MHCWFYFDEGIRERIFYRTVKKSNKYKIKHLSVNKEIPKRSQPVCKIYKVHMSQSCSYSYVIEQNDCGDRLNSY